MLFFLFFFRGVVQTRPKPLLLLCILKFVLETRTNIELNKVNSCDFSVSGSVC